MQAPTVLEINTRVWLAECQWKSVNDIPDSHIDAWVAQGITMIWLMGVWEPSTGGREITFAMPAVLAECDRVLAGSVPDAVLASPYAIRTYTVSARLGGPSELAKLRRRLHRRGLGLMLDFVPNHVAPDHPDVTNSPERFMHGSPADLLAAPQNWFAREDARGRIHLLAHGRDPYFDGWRDTVQLNYFHPDARRSMLEALTGIADQCDAVRCDMAMLVTHEVLMRTWGDRLVREGGVVPGAEFWSEAIPSIKTRHPEFIFLAEVYWDMEPALRALGFDYTYDKALYDAIRDRHADIIRAVLMRPGADRQARFLENHDEPRAASTFDGFHAAAAALTFALPGLRLLHEGQLEGRRVKLPVQLGARPQEAVDAEVSRLYDRLLPALRQQAGQWSLPEPRPAGDDSYRQAVAIRLPERLIIANVAPYPVQGFVAADGPGTVFHDVLSGETYHRDAAELAATGLYFALQPGQAHFFEVA